MSDETKVPQKRVFMQNAWEDEIIKLGEEGLEISENLLGAECAAMSGLAPEVKRLAKLNARRQVNGALANFALDSFNAICERKEQR